MSKNITLHTGLYAITHHDDLSAKKLLQDVQAALTGGASTIQFRDKHSSSTERLKRAKALKDLCKEFQVPLIINDDFELCHRVGADGVHLGLTDGSIKTARDLLGDSKLIGATCHNSLPLALQAQKEGANYIALGKFFPSQTKNEAPLANIQCIQEIKEQCSLPIVAIGGITLDNASALIGQRVHAIAVINDLFSDDNIQERAQLFCSLFNNP